MSYSVIVKEDCATCQLVVPVIKQLKEDEELTIYSQDNVQFPPDVSVIDDTQLEYSWHRRIETVPTLIKFGEDGEELARVIGWEKSEWQALTGKPLEFDLPNFRPGCGSKSQDPGMPEKLAARYDRDKLQSRELNISAEEDAIEACFDRGWSDGLPVVPPTPERVMRMLTGTNRSLAEVVGVVPPDLVPCTIEKIAINAVLAGCKPEYLPVVIAAVEAALQDEFCMHGLLATTYYSGPLVIVNGPMSRAIGMNAKGNALGQGNRANATIGRALQLVIRNVGGGKPGGVDRSAFGNPGKYTYCFSEDETNSCWESLAVEKGFSETASTVTLFAADGMQGIVDQKSRAPESLSRSFAAALRVIGHPKMILASDAILVVSPEHERVYRQAGWSKQDVKDCLNKLLTIDGTELVVGAGGIAEGIPEKLGGKQLPKFREGGLNIVRAGGSAGMFSAIIAGWGASGTIGSTPVTREIK
ncbi:MAG: thioredoxin family protein [Candidatus Azotimanducaceae bacterium WSBS_2022_MAG_OTU7]